MNNRRRYALVMLLGVLMNELLNGLAQANGWPVWLDVSGTALAALVLEPTAGLLVGLVNNFVLALTSFGSGSLIFYAVSAAVALIVGLVLRPGGGKLRVGRIGPAMGLVLVASTLLSTLLTLWRSGGMPSSVWEIYFYELALGQGASEPLACLFGIFVIKISDTVATALVVAAVYLLLPRVLRHGPQEQKQL